ncbi:MAG: beta-eliminating lyase-related protein [Treponema sp.]|nr:beta-eliminating lyase-related protein [Treponema sp.]
MNVDLRSDTVTQPTAEMRELIHSAALGDDMVGEDPSINELEAYCAGLLGKEAAMYVVSGVMGNLTSLLTHTNRGEEIIFEAESHIYSAEAGGFAILGGLAAIPVKGHKGAMDIEEVKKAYKSGIDSHYMKTGLICMETTHNFSGGYALPLDHMRDVYNFASSVKVPVHLDGARIFNAASFLGCDVKEITRYCDSLMVCFSKGLCAPVGSIIAGSKEFMEKAKRIRKILGGAMRQAGVLAAPALYAIKNMRDRLGEDRERAIKLAQGFRDLGFIVDADNIQSNIVMLYTPPDWKIDAPRVVELLATKGILCFDLAPNKVRFVTHYYITDEAVEYTLKAGRELFG